MDRKGTLSLRPLSIALSNLSIDARLTDHGLRTLAFLQSASLSVGRSQNGDKTAASHASDAAKLEGHRTDFEVIREAVCVPFQNLDKEALIVLRASSMPGLPDAMRANPDLYCIVAPFFLMHGMDLPEMHEVFGLVQYTPVRHHRVPDYSSLTAPLTVRSAKDTNQLFSELDAARARVADEHLHAAPRAVAKVDAARVASQLYQSGVHSAAGRGRCPYALHLPPTPTAGTAFVDRDGAGYFGLAPYGQMHVQNLGIFKHLVLWVLHVISNQVLTPAAARVLGGRERRALFGVRLSHVPPFSDGIANDHRSWTDGIRQKFFSAKEIRSALHALIPGIGFDSLVIADGALRAKIFTALERACYILHLQRRKSMTYGDVDACRAAHLEMVEALADTTFVTFRSSGLNYPKWRMAFLFYDDIERFGVPLGFSEEGVERSMKRLGLIVHNNTNKIDPVAQVQRRLAELNFCGSALPRLIGEPAPGVAPGLVVPSHPTFGMRGMNAPLPASITVATISAALLRYLDSRPGGRPEGFAPDPAKLVFFKGMFLQRATADDPIDTSFYSVSSFHGKPRYDIARLFEDSGDGRGAQLSSDPRTALLARLVLAFCYIDATLNDASVVDEVAADDDADIAAEGSGVGLF